MIEDITIEMWAFLGITVSIAITYFTLEYYRHLAKKDARKEIEKVLRKRNKKPKPKTESEKPKMSKINRHVKQLNETEKLFISHGYGLNLYINEGQMTTILVQVDNPKGELVFERSYETEKENLNQWIHDTKAWFKNSVKAKLFS